MTLKTQKNTGESAEENPSPSHRHLQPLEFPVAKDQSSLLFRLFLKILALFRPFYRWAKRKWPHYFERRLNIETNLDTSRMLSRVNRLHKLFFGRSMEKISFAEADLDNIREAQSKGPVLFLMRNWGQVEYNFFNHLFKQKSLPLVIHNNMVKMGHWMPFSLWKRVVFHKVDQFFTHKKWSYNNPNFNLKAALQENLPVLLCLDLPQGSTWVERDFNPQLEILKDVIKAQQDLEDPLQIVPLHFIYDKHPGRQSPTLGDVILGSKENPGYLRKILLFLRNYKKRAAAKIGNPVDTRGFLSQLPDPSRSAQSHALLSHLQKTFDKESRQVTGPKLKSRRQMMNQILMDPEFQTKLEALAKQEGLTIQKAKKSATKYLKEITSDTSYTIIQLWNVFLSWLFHRFYDGLAVDKKGIAKIKKVAVDRPIVLVPCHKSHMDYLLMSYAFYYEDLSLPLVCAGKNLNFWPLGTVFRKSGAYFIRRTFAGNKLYALALKSYVGELMEEGYFQEFFIEGTRSRSGKLFPAKLGMLSMTVECFLERSLEDVYLVPVSIDYERVPEERSYLEEAKGKSKSKERFSDLFRLPKYLRAKYGKVYLQFGDPISLKQRLAKQPQGFEKDPEKFKPFLSELGQEIGRSINQVSTLLPTSLVATTLLSPYRKSMTSKEIHQRLDEVFAKTNSDSTRLSQLMAKDLHHAGQEALDQFVRTHLITAHNTFTEKFYTLPDESRLPLNYFKNMALHLFAESALAQIISERTQGMADNSPQSLWTFARELLHQEFYFHPETQQLPKEDKLPSWLLHALDPLLESYWLSLRTIQQVKPQKSEEWLLVRKIMEAGQVLILKGEMEYPESLSKFTIQNALHQFVQMGILKDHSVEMGRLGRKYYSFGPTAGPRHEAENYFKLLLGK